MRDNYVWTTLKLTANSEPGYVYVTDLRYCQ